MRPRQSCDLPRYGSPRIYQQLIKAKSSGRGEARKEQLEMGLMTFVLKMAQGQNLALTVSIFSISLDRGYQELVRSAMSQSRSAWETCTGKQAAPYTLHPEP